MKRISVASIAGEDAQADYDLFVFCVGFEARSRHLAQTIGTDSTRLLAIAYEHEQILAFASNLEFVESLENCDTVPDTTRKIEEAIKQVLASPMHRGGLRVAIDVSAMNRSVMAAAMIAVLDALSDGDTLSLIYAPAKFRQPALNLLPIRPVGVCHPQLSGIVSGPDDGRALLLGLGYEYGVSARILDTHEPDMSYIFKPNGFDDRFEQSVERANFHFDFGERNYEIIDYYLDNMAAAYNEIASLIAGIKHHTNVICAPIGPKILSAVMILAAYVHHPRVSVLRYSLASTGLHEDVEASGEVVGVRLNVLPSIRQT